MSYGINRRNAAMESNLLAENTLLKQLLASSLAGVCDGEKIGRVFHDFNNILSSSMGYASLAHERSKTMEDEKLARYLENIERAGVRARDLVRDCLEARRSQREEHKVSLREVASRAGGDIACVLPDRDRLHISESHLLMTLELLFKRYDSTALLLKGELLEDAYCHACEAELRGTQMCITGDIEREGEHHRPEQVRVDRELLQALVNCSGGHLCDALMQDKKFTIYFRSVMP